MNEYDTLMNSYSTFTMHKNWDYIMYEWSECTTTICNQDFYWFFYHCGHSSNTINIHYLFNGYIMTYIMSYHDWQKALLTDCYRRRGGIRRWVQEWHLLGSERPVQKRHNVTTFPIIAALLIFNHYLFYFLSDITKKT